MARFELQHRLSIRRGCCFNRHVRTPNAGVDFWRGRVVVQRSHEIEALLGRSPAADLEERPRRGQARRHARPEVGQAAASKLHLSDSPLLEASQRMAEQRAPNTAPLIARPDQNQCQLTKWSLLPGDLTHL